MDALDGLSDVVITTATTNDFLSFDGSKWVNRQLFSTPNIWTAAQTINTGGVTQLVVGRSAPYGTEFALFDRSYAGQTQLMVSNQTNNAASEAVIRLATSGSDWYLTHGSTAKNANKFTIRNTATDFVTIDTSGNFGIGVTPSAWAGTTALQLTGGSLNSFGGGPSLNQNCYFDGTNWRYIATGFAARYAQINSSGHVWYNGASAGAGTVVTFSQVMQLDASGNLLQFAGAVWSAGGLVGEPSGKHLISGYDTTNNIGYIRSANNGTTFTELRLAGSSVSIYTGSTSSVLAGTWDVFGNLGIGVVPVVGYKLQTNGTILFQSSTEHLVLAGSTAGTVRWSVGASDYGSLPTYTGVSLISVGSTVAGTGAWVTGIANAGLHALWFQNIGASVIGSNSANPFIFAPNSTERMRLDGSGNLGIGVTPTQKLHISLGNTGANPGTSGTAQAGGIGRFQHGNATVDIGGYSAGGGWIQSCDVTNLATQYPLFLQPNGGIVSVSASPVAGLGFLQVGYTAPIGDQAEIAYFGGVNITGNTANVLIASGGSAFAAGSGGTLGLGGKYNTAGNLATFAMLKGCKLDGVDGNFGGFLAFMTRANGGNITERVRVTAIGDLELGAISSTPPGGGRYLDIYNLENTTGTSAAVLRFVTYRNDGVSATSADIVKNRGGEWSFVNYEPTTNSQLRFQANSGVSVYINQYGLGIGATATAADYLRVAGDAYVVGHLRVLATATAPGVGPGSISMGGSTGRKIDIYESTVTHMGLGVDLGGGPHELSVYGAAGPANAGTIKLGFISNANPGTWTTCATFSLAGSSFVSEVVVGTDPAPGGGQLLRASSMRCTSLEADTTISTDIDCETLLAAATFSVGGSLSIQTRNIATSGTTSSVLSSDYLVNMTGVTTHTLTLPASVNGHVIIIARASTTGTITINRSGADTINGGTSTTIVSPQLSKTFVRIGTDWRTVAVG